jgi:hypothetical protein
MMVELNVNDLYSVQYIHCKKRLMIFLSPAGTSNFLWPGIIKLFPARESFVGDIPAGDGKIDNLFKPCISKDTAGTRQFQSWEHKQIYMETFL